MTSVKHNDNILLKTPDNLHTPSNNTKQTIGSIAPNNIIQQVTFAIIKTKTGTNFLNSKENTNGLVRKKCKIEKF